ncbi:MAG: dethiobiotin synthase [Bernardetiaceae bacterium]|nr:dethiobiotin synthase [Bernardetiaceae bacterium]
MPKYFITAIGTDSGKSLVSAIFTEALEADYWKPIQAGAPHDADFVRPLISNAQTQILPETYCLAMPASPHAAAAAEGVLIDKTTVKLPNNNRSLIVEGAGGLLVPLNDKDFIIDLIAQLELPVVLVANLYLGSINHSLLSYEALALRNIKIAGIVFNGLSNPESERIILHHTGLPVLLRLPAGLEVSAATVKHYAAILKGNLL